MSRVSTAGFFHLRETPAGNDCHAFGNPINVSGPFRPSYSQATLSFSIDEFIKMFGVRRPDHIKLDVDSIEDKILAGARETLPFVQTLLIEVDAQRSQAWRDRVYSMLESAGLFETDTPPGGRNRLFLRRAAKRPVL